MKLINHDEFDGLLVYTLFFQYFEKDMSLAKLLHIIKEYRPSYMIIGSHFYVQLSEIDLTTVGVTPSDLRSVKVICPSGAAVPRTCAAKLRKRFPLSAWHVHGLGQTENMAFTGGLLEMTGVGSTGPAVECYKVSDCR